MIKNKVKKGMILIYTDEYGNQKAISPDELLVITGTVITNELTKEKKVGTGTPKKLGVLLSELTDKIESLENELTKAKEEFYNFKSKQIQNTNDLIENQSIQNKKLESLSNDVKALLSINK